MTDSTGRSDRLDTAFERRIKILEDAEREGTERRLHHVSPDGVVGVLTDGNGNFVELTITPGALTGPHPQLLPEIIRNSLNTARGTARARQSQVAMDRLRELT